jgi:hypothetical protein
MKAKTFLLRGLPLLREATNDLIRHPEDWDQTSPFRERPHCIAAHARMIGEIERERLEPIEWLRKRCGISIKSANWLFSRKRTLPQIRNFVARRIKGVLPLPREVAGEK